MSDNWEYVLIECPICKEKDLLKELELQTRCGYENFLECTRCGILMRE